MSEIDTIAHELCGTVAGLPLYHPLSEITFSHETDLVCTPRHLLLGGGGGEHPEMRIDARAAVKQCIGAYLLADEALTYEETQALEALHAAQEADLAATGDEMHVPADSLGVSDDDHLFNLRLAQAGLTYERYDALDDVLAGPLLAHGFPARAVQAPDWGGDMWAAFIATASQPAGWATPYDPEKHIRIADWIAGVVGEYVLLCYPEIMELDEETTIALAPITEMLRARPLYMGVMGFPRGYDLVGGCQSPVGTPNVRH